ncbi:hypothetical protein ZHAS_00013874 [Anopheles sinensis]|uniref:Uncharacterized protein n=1 Tax=Anopheles sinensis TaxID=74873 RepID=A0A084W6M7_ANOSI|nr:hypothetical protein ZHAS_00013874 [Anopheles sinensis]
MRWDNEVELGSVSCGGGVHCPSTDFLGERAVASERDNRNPPGSFGGKEREWKISNTSKHLPAAAAANAREGRHMWAGFDKMRFG